MSRWHLWAPLALMAATVAAAQEPLPLRCVFLAEDGMPLAGVPASAELIAAVPGQGARMGTQGITTAQGEFLVLLPDATRPWWVLVGVPGAAFFVDATAPKKLPASLKCWLGEKPSAICQVVGDSRKVALFLRLAGNPWWLRLPPAKDGQLLLFRLPPGQHQLVMVPASVQAFWDGVPALQTVTAAITPDRPVELTFTVTPMGRVVGTVADLKGQPIRDATVTLERDGFGIAVATTDGQGRFQLDAVPVGEYRLLVFARDYETATHKVAVRPDETVTVAVTLAPQPLGVLKGRVVREDGAAVLNGRVLIERVLSPTARQPIGVWAIQPDGRFEGKVREGTYALTVQVGGRRVTRTAKVVADKVTDLGDIRLPSPAIVEGRVRNLAPGARWSVRIVALDGTDDPLQPQWTSVVAEVPLSADGRFQAEVPPGSLAVVVQPLSGGRPLVRRVQVRAGQRVTVHLTVPRPGAIEGQVVRADTGRPVPGAIVTLLDETGVPVAQTMTNPLGLYRFDFVLPGRYTVRCQGRGLALGVRHEVRVAEGSRVPVDFVLTPGGSIVGKVRGQKGATARLYVLVDADSNWVGSVAADGSFRVDFIPPGRHIVMLFRLGDLLAAKEVQVHSGETVEVTFDLP